MKNKILIICLFLGYNLTAQETKIDSLMQDARSAQGIELVKVYNKLSWEYKNPNLDSAKHYGFLAKELAEDPPEDRLLAISSAPNSIANVYEALVSSQG